MDKLPITDPLQREQAATLQSLIFVLIAASLIGVPLSLSATSQVDRLVGIGSSLVQMLLLIVAAVVLRRGQFSAAVALVIVSTVLFAALNMIPTGLEGSRAIFTALTIPHRHYGPGSRGLAKNFPVHIHATRAQLEVKPVIAVAKVERD